MSSSLTLAALALASRPPRAVQHVSRRASALAACAVPDPSRRSGLCVIDSHNLAYRMQFAMPELTSRQGEPAQALLGFCNKLVQLRDVFPGYRMLAVFDEGAPARRVEMLPEYKETRAPMPPALRSQMGHIREAAECLGVPTISRFGVEADDLIACAVALARSEGAAAVSIVTSDKDLLQLVSGDSGGDAGALDATNVTVFDDRKKVLLDAAAVQAKHGVRPDQLVDLLALVGDASDNVPGVPGAPRPALCSSPLRLSPCSKAGRGEPCPSSAGVGQKTAAKLLGEHGTLDAVLAAAPSMKKSKRRDALIAHAEQDTLPPLLSPTARDETPPPSPPDALLPPTRPHTRPSTPSRRPTPQARLARQLVQLDASVGGVDPEELRGALPAPPAELPHLRDFLQHHGFTQLERRLFKAREAIERAQRKRGSPRPAT